MRDPIMDPKPGDRFQVVNSQGEINRYIMADVGQDLYALINLEKGWAWDGMRETPLDVLRGLSATLSDLRTIGKCGHCTLTSIGRAPATPVLDEDWQATARRLA